MRSSSGSRAVIVGIFTLVGLAILAVFILTLGSQRKTFTSSITVKSYFSNVNGLQKGNNIWFTGVKVGTIRSVSIIESSKVEVQMYIDKSAKKFIHKDVRAKLSSDGLIGNKIIELYGGTPDLPNIEEGDIIATDTLFSTEALMSTLSENNDNLLGITSNLKIITDQIVQGKGTLGKIMNDETLTDQINLLAASLNRSAVNIEKLSAAASDYTEKLNKPGTLANDLVSDTTVFANLRDLTERLRVISDSSQIFVNSLNETGKSLNASLDNPNTPLGMMLKDEKAAKQIKGILGNLQTATEKLNEDLEALKSNFLFRRYFKKQAKLEKSKQSSVSDTTFSN
ncbi:MAG: MCE family protein [Chitinophagaceae bacterium]|nr:MCE family protein [Chitinophagaceae bacterium]